MPELTFRGNLNAATWPFTTTRQGRSVVVGQLDTNFSKFQAFSGRDDDRDVGIPQALFLQNVIPSAEGYSSVGYRLKIPASGVLNDFDRAHLIADSANRKGIFVPASGSCYVYNANNAAWYAFNLFPPGEIGGTTLVTVASVQQRTFIFIETKGLYEYDFVGNALASVTVTGLGAATIIGAAGSNDYLVLFDDENNLYYSSLTDPTDFTPSLITGAGTLAVIELRGKLKHILPISGGAVLYSSENAVYMAYTGNVRLPWTFREIPGSGGVTYPEHVTFEANLSYHYAWSSKGLLKIEKNIATGIFPEVTDFLTGGLLEDMDYGTLALSRSVLNSTMLVKLTHIGGRYLVISYGATSFTHALLYDEQLKRWGKLKIAHTDCFAWNSPNLFGEITYQMLLDAGVSYEDLLYTSYTDLMTIQDNVTTPRQDVAFLQSNGQVYLADFDITQDDHQGVLILGKYAVTRAQDLTLHSIDIESVVSGNTSYGVKIWTSYDGKTLASEITTPVQTRATDYLRRFEMFVTGLNHCIVNYGSFALCSIELTGRQAGRAQGRGT